MNCALRYGSYFDILWYFFFFPQVSDWNHLLP
uniref:Uncharacterized protein n=1 Tax=Rhizophora mucronata TaxID=61149 RepID=A0A2P2PF10_RHIMU